jgi:hypothetical protein
VETCLTPTDLPLFFLHLLIMSAHAKEHSPYGDQKPDRSGEFIEDASTPAELEALNVDEKALVRKV